MIQAEIKGKIPEVRNMEDALTSNVFGLLKYVKQREVLLRILSQAESLSGKRFPVSVEVDLKTYSPEFLFWKQLGSYGEPDLIINFRKPGEADLVLCIEVKYYSSKSGEGDDDQLKRYFEGMKQFASLRKSTFLGLIYLTKYPSGEEIKKSRDYIREKGNTDAEDKLYQLKWTEIASTIDEIIESPDTFLLTDGERMILRDLSEYLDHKNLTRFTKFSFLSKQFDIRPDHFYELAEFDGFTFLRDDFKKPEGRIFYKGG